MKYFKIPMDSQDCINSDDFSRSRNHTLNEHSSYAGFEISRNPGSSK